MLPSSPRLATPLALALLLSTTAAAQQLTLSWEKRFDGTASLEDYAGDVVVDPAGAVYTVGATFVSAGSNLYVPRFITLKYSPQGQLLWSRTFGSGFYGGMGNAQHVALRPGGGVIVGGATNGGHDWGAVAYDDAGNELWTRVWLAGSSFVSNVDDMAVSTAGDVFLCGNVGTGGKSQAAVLSIDSAGQLVWVRLFDGTTGPSYVNSVAAATAGSCVIGGARPDAGGSYQMCLTAIDGAGNDFWTTDVPGAGSKPFGSANAVAIGPGRIYAAGYLSASSGADGDAAVVAVNGLGTVQWIVRHDAGAQGSDELMEIAVDSQAGVVGTGMTTTASGDHDALTLRVDVLGNLQWARTYAGPQSLDDEGYDVALGPGNEVFVVGTGVPQAGGRQILALGYNPAGVLVWEDHYGGPTGDDNWGFGVAAGPSGEVVVTGESPGIGTRYDIVTLRYDTGPGGITAYCTAKPSSQGCPPSIGWSGTPSVTLAAPFLVTALQVINNKNGILFYGTTGRAVLPFQGGILCVNTPIKRTPGQSSAGNPPPNDCSGSFSYDFNARIQSGADPLLVAGAQVQAQYWFRDPPASFGSGLSDAIEFLIGP